MNKFFVTMEMYGCVFKAKINAPEKILADDMLLKRVIKAMDDAGIDFNFSGVTFYNGGNYEENCNNGNVNFNACD